MKELIESLNLPKQIIDKTEKFLTTIFGSAAKEIGELIADKVRYKRMKNQINIFNKTRVLLEKNNLEPRELNLKTLVPLIENSSLEDEELLSDKWANLIANMVSSPEDGLEPKLIKTLSNLSSIEAQVLDKSYELFFTTRKLQWDRYQQGFLKDRYPKVEDIKRDQVYIKFNQIRETFDLSEEFSKICIDNLEALGLVRYEEPELEVDKGWSEGTINEIEEGGTVDLDLDLSVTYFQSNNFCITYYGFYFIEKCQAVHSK
ncbi:MAG: DUF4393 domain-containing protein [Winogradskyella sp.]|uniref:Abi-alpha family protein n=1 Tax=Winogradskyella sp. TaxID=1883156 RepID=UPI001807BE3D|nr:DUF4393 domain-containing protein [Winogradskyella sp.]